jgi:hypothetical protein
MQRLKSGTKNNKYRLEHDVMDEDMLVSLCRLIPGDNLRRSLARCLWFDVVDQLPDGMRMDRLKAMADPDRLDDGIDWSLEDEQLALGIVGYTEEQVKIRMRIHLEHRQREQREGVTELRRALDEQRRQYLPRMFHSGRLFV